MQDPVWKHRKDRHDNRNPDFDYEAWKRKHIAFADVAVPRWVDAVKESYGTSTTKFACVGYCFGAPYVCDQLKGDVVTVGAFAHPAFLKERHFQDLKSKSWSGALASLKLTALKNLCSSHAQRLITHSTCHQDGAHWTSFNLIRRRSITRYSLESSMVSL